MTKQLWKTLSTFAALLFLSICTSNANDDVVWEVEINDSNAVFSADGSKVFVTGYSDSKFYVIDTKTGEVLRKIEDSKFGKILGVTEVGNFILTRIIHKKTPKEDLTRLLFRS